MVLPMQAVGVDSLEPQYPCSTANTLFSAIKSTGNPDWKRHLELTEDLFHALDDISGVRPDDGGFHASVDHYYDNLSARQCHDKPLPCKLIRGRNSTQCVAQDLADSVYRVGNWEYSHIYRDHPSSLSASSLSLGVWIGELTNHLQDVVNGQSDILYFHNIAHDGSVSRLLSILQIDNMVWPGMGSEVVFELYRRKKHILTPDSTAQTEVGRDCSWDDCLRYCCVNQNMPFVGNICRHRSTPTTMILSTTATRPTECSDQNRPSSACICLSSLTNADATPTATEKASPSSAPSSSGFYVRILFGGKVLTSSNPSLGSVNMLPVEVLLDYLDELVGKEGHLVKSKCQP
ncbi:hypothetical protein E4U42_003382 [Claviceps africana]|uniref:Uncharacterized protein n=1 Tax=Claviceps africana TaxID=83212 RepID=A0A8K0J6V1_9HYPO|nr:hypothetical protein E4U42_003382 [Claviceps africana]